MRVLEETTPFDAADYIQTPEDVEHFLQSATEEAFEEDDPSIITMALGVVARSKGMAQIAATTGVTREGLYASLGKKGSPKFSTVFRIFRALGLQLSPITPARPS